MRINYDRRKVFVDEQEIKLTQTEYNIVAFLSQHAGRVMTYAAIVKAIWGDTDIASSTKKLQVNMANIRKKLGSRPGSNAYILNELGVGYRMIDEDDKARNLRRKRNDTGADPVCPVLYIDAGGAAVPPVGGAVRCRCSLLLLGKLGVYDFTLRAAPQAVDYNVLLMMAGTMGTVAFCSSRAKCLPGWRKCSSPMCRMSGGLVWCWRCSPAFISAFVDNVATVLMVAPVGLPLPAS